MRGAFTGAVGNRQGRLEQAHKGTLFIDEVGTMTAAPQMKLLRVLQEREFERVGDSPPSSRRARDRRDERRSRTDGRRWEFRGDLFYRLNVIPVQLPPLREEGRHPAVVQHFLDK